MKTQYFDFLAFLCRKFKPFYPAYTLLISRLSKRKRRQSLGEVRRFIDIILSEPGDEGAIERAKICFEKCEHYRISLEEAGFRGTWSKFGAEAVNSTLRAADRKRDTLLKFGFAH